jgi:hypothetical protein
MIKIIGNKDEISSLIDAINNTDSYFTTYEYIEQEKDTFNVQCRYMEQDLDYMVRLEYEEEGIKI